MKTYKFSNLEFQVNNMIKSSFSFQELHQLSSEMMDILKGAILSQLVITGEISQDKTRSFYQDILAHNHLLG